MYKQVQGKITSHINCEILCNKTIFSKVGLHLSPTLVKVEIFMGIVSLICKNKVA